jgi:hypothetical protein
MGGLGNAKMIWRVKLRWASGGEAFFEDDERVARPWWMSPNDTRPEQPPNHRSRPEIERDLRKEYYSFLPLDLLAPSNSHYMGRGWHCKKCGKLNERLLLRMRRCESSYCKVSSGNLLSIVSNLSGVAAIRGGFENQRLCTPAGINTRTVAVSAALHAVESVSVDIGGLFG